VRDRHGDAIVKAAGPTNHHIQREIQAHRAWTRPWVASGSVGRLLHAAQDEVMLAVEYLPGDLVQDLPEAAGHPDTYRQAGALLAAFHGQTSRVDPTYEAAADARALAWLDSEHRIPSPIVARLRAAIAGHDHPPVQVVPTHGDWQTRNWLVDDGTIRVIDLGRAGWRPAVTDLARLARREWEGRPDLEAAFLEGYGHDPRDPNAWRATLLREAIGTAVWAHQVGDLDFEEHGHHLIGRALELYGDS
jgi:Ser/Thr protein kinase RdoA (MazF antagonist)